MCTVELNTKNISFLVHHMVVWGRLQVALDKGNPVLILFDNHESYVSLDTILVSPRKLNDFTYFPNSHKPQATATRCSCVSTFQK
ncbi:hypothetical protein PR048_020864 [Dryococelus australis]|uniref:DDE-1 domain-containing protein n=1 Tax=Dryococelus australis TaxID=614101 RepID=A0ABQ9GWP2_9NEOP|nr:hypothetical protein PR048_020864 [Dryococelus australis]